MIAHRFGIDRNELSGAKSAPRMVVNDLNCPVCNSQQCAQPPLARSVPLSRFTSRVGGGSAFYVRHLPHFMRKPQLITLTAAILAAILITSCSKRHASAPPNTTDMAKKMKAYVESLTNSLDGLQARFQEEEKQIHGFQAKLDLLRKSYKTNDQPYLDEQGKYEQMLGFHKLLYSRIESDKLDA
jgi:hypothetical protein